MNSFTHRLFLLRFMAGTTLITIHLGVASFVSAVDRTWINGSGGLFTEVANWDTGVPGAGDKAIFDGAGAGTIQIDFANATFNIAELEVGEEQVRFDLNGGTLDSSGTNQVGTVGGLGLLTIDDGTLKTPLMNVGSPFPGGASGQVFIDSAGRLITDIVLFVGPGDSDSDIMVFGGTLDVGFGDPSGGDLFLGLTGRSGDLTLFGLGATANVSGDIHIHDLSDLTLNGSSLVTVGQNVNVMDGGQIHLNAAGSQLILGGDLNLNTGGEFLLNNGFFTTPKLGSQDGDLNFSSGTIHLTSPLGHSFSPGDGLDDLRNLTAGKTFIDGGVTTLGGTQMVLNGGTLETVFLFEETTGDFIWTSGTLRFTSVGLLILQNNTFFGRDLTIASDKTLEFTSAGMRVGKDTMQGSSTLQVTGTGSLYVENGLTVSGIDAGFNVPRLFVNSGGTVTTPDNLRIGDSTKNHHGEIQVTGIDSTVNVGDNLDMYNDTELRVQTSGQVQVDGALTMSDDAELLVQTSGQVQVDGALSMSDNAKLFALTSSQVFIGLDLALEMAAQVNIESNASVVVGGRVIINSGGQVNVDGGFLTAADITAGDLNYSIGTVHFTSPVGQPFFQGDGLEDLRSLTTGKKLIVDNTTTLNGTTLTLDGGTLSTGAIVVESGGSFVWREGTLSLTGGITTIDLTVPFLHELNARGAINGKVTSPTTSTISATGPLALGDASAFNGFYSNGSLNVNDNAVTLNDANTAVFDSGAFVSLGSAGTGSIGAANGLTLDFGGTITGFGAINTPDDPATPLINNGHIAGDSPANVITLSGYVKGVGTLDNVNITGTDAPGFSPASVSRGSVSYNGTLEIEIGGTSPGSDFDQLNHILGAGLADLGGTLDISLINGFTPSAGDTFEIITSTSILDTFDTINLPSLPGDLLWFVNYSATSVELVSTLGADFDENGTVDDDDLAIWANGFGNSPAAHRDGDANADTFVGGFDFLTWQRQRGMGGATINTSVVPEPSTLLLATLGLLLLPARWKRT